MPRTRAVCQVVVSTVMAFVLASCADGRPPAPSFRLFGEGVEAHPSNPGADFTLDFGLVALGVRHSPAVFIANDGTKKLSVEVEDSERIVPPFHIGFQYIEVPGPGAKKVEISFHPHSLSMESGPFDALLTLKTNEKEGTRTIRLLGVAVREDLDCSPKEVDFGWVVRGESSTRTVHCNNPLTVPLTLLPSDFDGPYHQHFSAEFPGKGRALEIQPGASASFDLEFRAWGPLSGPIHSAFHLLDANGKKLAGFDAKVNVAEHALQVRTEKDGERIPLEGCLSFPSSDVAEPMVKTLFLRNLSKNPVNLQALSLEGAESPFSIEQGEPVLIPANGVEEIPVSISFLPTSSGQHRDTLVFQSDDTLEPEEGIRVCVEAPGRSPRFSCTPSSVDFDQVAVGKTRVRSYACTIDVGVIYINSVTSTDPLFHPTLRNANGSIGPLLHGYLEGEDFWIDVAYSPDDEGIDTATIHIESSASQSPRHETEVQGQGRDVPPCNIAFSPSSLRFGVVPPGGQGTLVSYLENLDPVECVIGNLRLDATSHASFQMAEEDMLFLPPSGRLPINLAFSPTEPGSFTGAVQFDLHGPQSPSDILPLAGTSSRACLAFESDSIDFGQAAPGCSGRETLVSLMNVCDAPLSIVEISIDPAYDAFHISPTPSLPRHLAPGKRLEFSTYFRPGTPGKQMGAIHVEVVDLGDGADIGPYVLPVEGAGSSSIFQTDGFLQENKKVDVLIVADNSGAVETLKNLVSDHVEELFQQGILNGIDFHVGVTTTGVAGNNGNACTNYTGFTENEKGRLVPHPSIGRPRILTSAMPMNDFFETFERNMEVGSCHGNEALYEAARLALSPPNTHTPGEEAGNLGFLRRDAALAIIGITDEDDTDSYWDGDRNADRSVARYVNFFQSLKPSWKKHLVKFHALSGGPTECSTPWAMACPRCLEGAALTGGLWLDACRPSHDPAWASDFKKLSQGNFGFEDAFLLRGGAGDANGDGITDELDLEVKVGGSPVPATNRSGTRIWSFDPTGNSVTFSPLHVPSSGQLVEVTYKLACLSHDG